MVFENGVKNIQAAAYNGARTVYVLPPETGPLEHVVNFLFQPSGHFN